MLSQKTKKILSFVFLSAFILIKVSGLHALEHKDDRKSAKDCVWCHLARTDNNTPILEGPDLAVEFVDLNPVFYSEVIDHYTSLSSDKMDICSIFNKPPPFTV